MIAQEWQIEQKDKGSSLYLEKQGPSLSFTNLHITWHFVCPVVLGALESFAFWGKGERERCCNNGQAETLPAH